MSFVICSFHFAEKESLRLPLARVLRSRGRVVIGNSFIESKDKDMRKMSYMPVINSTAVEPRKSAFQGTGQNRQIHCYCYILVSIENICCTFLMRPSIITEVLSVFVFRMSVH